VLVAGVPAVLIAILPKTIADLGGLDISWISNYTWFIGCGLGYLAFAWLEKTSPRMPVLDASDDAVSDGTVA